jgi:hypothetical protein
MGLWQVHKVKLVCTNQKSMVINANWNQNGAQTKLSLETHSNGSP